MKYLAAILILMLRPTAAHCDSLNSAEPIQPLPVSGYDTDGAKIALGERLFHEKSLSKNQTVSCSSCHNLQSGGADGLPKSFGINGTRGDINSPTVFNSAFNFRQFWNGRVKTLEEQVDRPIQNPKELGSRWSEVLARLRADPTYRKAFADLYPEGITRSTVANALAAFERSLVTPNSKFDRFLRGEENAISAEEKIGYQKFKALGCVACHQGMNVGGNMYQTMGVMGDYFRDRGQPETEADQGRYAVTKQEADRHVFRVPSLRNVALTAPYFHDGSAATLEDAVKTMARYQLGRKLSQEEIHAIVAFLKTLTGELPLKRHEVAGGGSK